MRSRTSDQCGALRYFYKLGFLFLQYFLPKDLNLVWCCLLLFLNTVQVLEVKYFSSYFLDTTFFISWFYYSSLGGLPPKVFFFLISFLFHYLCKLPLEKHLWYVPLMENSSVQFSRSPGCRTFCCVVKATLRIY